MYSAVRGSFSLRLQYLSFYFLHANTHAHTRMYTRPSLPPPSLPPTTHAHTHESVRLPVRAVFRAHALSRALTHYSQFDCPRSLRSTHVRSHSKKLNLQTKNRFFSIYFCSVRAICMVLAHMIVEARRGRNNNNFIPQPQPPPLLHSYFVFFGINGRVYISTITTTTTTKLCTSQRCSLLTVINFVSFFFISLLPKIVTNSTYFLAHY